MKYFRAVAGVILIFLLTECGFEILDENQLLSQLSQTGISEEDFYEIDQTNIDTLLDVDDDHDDCNDENFKFSFE